MCIVAIEAGARVLFFARYPVAMVFVIDLNQINFSIGKATVWVRGTGMVAWRYLSCLEAGAIGLAVWKRGRRSSEGADRARDADR